MNLQSLRWAFNAGQQHCTDPGQLTLLLVIASGVTRDHRGCVMSTGQLAEASLLSTADVRDHLAQLEAIGLIKRGNQKLAAGFAPDRRPVVWDLAHADRTGPDVRGRTTRNLPVALYRFFDATDRLLYIGATLDQDLRWANHSATKAWWPRVARQTVVWYETLDAAYLAERDAILEEKPLYNHTQCLTKRQAS